MSQAGMTQDVERFDPQGPPLRRIALEHRARYRLAAALADGRRVLDLGSGEGYGTAMIAKARAAVAVGVELSLGAVLRARRHFGGHGALFVVGNAHALPFAAASFDLLVSYEVIEHVLRPRQMLAEARRVLGADGQALLSTPNRLRTEEMSRFHLVEYAPEEFAELVQETFPGAAVWGQHSLAQSILGAESPEHGLTESDYLVALAPAPAGEQAAAGRMAVSLAEVEKEFQGLLDHYVDLVKKVDRDRQNLRQRLAELEQLGAGIDADRGNLAALVEELNQRLASIEEDRDNLRRLADEVAADCDNLRHALSEVTADRDNLRHALDEVTKDRDNLRHALEEITKDRDNWRRMHDGAEEDRVQLRQAFEQAQAKAAECDAWRAKAEHLAGDLDTVLGSRAWRILRALKIVRR